MSSGGGVAGSQDSPPLSENVAVGMKDLKLSVLRRVDYKFPPL